MDGPLHGRQQVAWKVFLDASVVLAILAGVWLAVTAVDREAQGNQVVAYSLAGASLLVAIAADGFLWLSGNRLFNPFLHRRGRPQFYARFLRSVPKWAVAATVASAALGAWIMVSTMVSTMVSAPSVPRFALGLVFWATSITLVDLLGDQAERAEIAATHTTTATATTPGSSRPPGA
jgi:hypothetical protein